ncbi:uncharacterized protein PSFLO_03995 [Pseudozyma flocculosa]|uniref:Uncharacterized protein n=1 Tax=Pseudozyma flocculosa TaxID=84751 RepID=A0A5C3F4B3_9BASI|nr:uncharacterized protein PSFLO_03995 [Pseudozyma flocculosa]
MAASASNYLLGRGAAAAAAAPVQLPPTPWPGLACHARPEQPTHTHVRRPCLPAGASLWWENMNRAQATRAEQPCLLLTDDALFFCHPTAHPHHLTTYYKPLCHHRRRPSPSRFRPARTRASVRSAGQIQLSPLLARLQTDEQQAITTARPSGGRWCKAILDYRVYLLVSYRITERLKSRLGTKRQDDEGWPDAGRSSAD